MRPRNGLPPKRSRRNLRRAAYGPGSAWDYELGSGSLMDPLGGPNFGNMGEKNKVKAIRWTESDH
jgi:hypothetical protein